MDRKRKPRGFTTPLSSAVSEWFLIFLLFVDAALSYLLTKFAQYCELETPCLFCSRLEHCFGKRKPGFYWSLLCSSHREEISTLASCKSHGQFADDNGMCEECLATLVTLDKSNSRSCRLLVGRSWVDVDKSVLQNLIVNKTTRLGSPDCRICSRCSKSLKAKTNAARLIELNSVTNVAAKANLKPPLPRAPGRSRFSRKENLKRLRGKAAEKSMKTGINGLDTLSHLGYDKRKISSHSDTEALLSEDEGDGKVSHCETYSEPDYDAQGDITSLQNPIVDNTTVEKSMHRAKPLLLEQHNLLGALEHKSIGSSLPHTLKENGQRDFNLEKSYSKPISSSEQISLDDSARQPDIRADSFDTSAGTSKCNGSLPQVPAFSGLPVLMSLSYAPFLNTMIPTKINDGRTSEMGDASVVQHTDAAAGTSSDGSCSFELNNMHQSDAFVQNVETEKFSDNHELSVEEDTSSQVLPVSALVKKTDDSSDETLDGIIPSEFEGENIVDKLKRQVELDRQYINSLYRELEEERNASAIAANQAMAMITRLQEEKAALHMEALQYLRMMDEQAEYDMEALAKANDLLAERERELQDMEYELDFYREYPDDDQIVADAANSPIASHNSTATEVSKTNGNSMLANGSVSSLEESKAYISQCLKRLEKKLQHSYVSGTLDNMCDGLSYEKVKAEENGHLHEKSDNRSSNQGETNPVNMQEEIAELRVRLEELEIDCNFLKCTSDLVRNEKGGLHFIQEIALQLQELRKMETRKR